MVYRDGVNASVKGAVVVRCVVVLVLVVEGVVLIEVASYRVVFTLLGI